MAAPASPAAAAAAPAAVLPRFDSRVGSGGDVSISSYNILLPDFVDARTYATTAPADRAWEGRRRKLMEEFLLLNTDFICLQECSLSDFAADFMMPPLSDRYGAVVQRAKNRAADHNFCNLTLYRLSDWEPEWTDHRSRTLVTCFRRKLPAAERAAVADVVAQARAAAGLDDDAAAVATEAEEGDEEKKDGGGEKGQGRRRRRDRKTNKSKRAKVPVWARHEPQDLVYVVNVHLEGDPYAVDKRCAQLRSALRRLEVRVRDPRYAWLEGELEDAIVFVAGDFNSSHNSPIYRALLSGLLKGGTRQRGVVITDTDWALPLAFQSAYAASERGEPLFTFAMHTMAADPLDFIFFNPRAVALAHVMAVAESDEVARHIRLTGLPDAVHPSDHLPIAATFRSRRATPFVERVREALARAAGGGVPDNEGE